MALIGLDGLAAGEAVTFQAQRKRHKATFVAIVTQLRKWEREYHDAMNESVAWIFLAVDANSDTKESANDVPKLAQGAIARMCGSLASVGELPESPCSCSPSSPVLSHTAGGPSGSRPYLHRQWPQRPAGPAPSIKQCG